MSFVDVPGHERFVRNMLAGLSGIEFALLVIAADDGPMPQTIEHLSILHLLGVRRGAVALTKIDAVSDARRIEASNDAQSILAGTHLSESPVFCVSSITGDGIEALEKHLREQGGNSASRTTSKHFRMSVDRRFTRPGSGLVVTGTALGGVLESGDNLMLLPSRIPVRARGIEVHGESREQASPGERCALNLAGKAGVADVNRGDWLAVPDASVVTGLIDTRLTALEHEAKGLREGTPVHLHIGAGDIPARVYPLESKLIEPGTNAYARIVIDGEVHANAGDLFIVRDQSARRTIGGGRIVDPLPPRRGARKPIRLRALSAQDNSDPRAAFASLLELEDVALPLDDFIAGRNLSGAEAAELLEGGNDYPSPRVLQLRGFRVALSRRTWDNLLSLIEQRLEQFHSEHPDESGPRQADLVRTPPGELTSAIVGHAVDALITSGKARRSSATVQLATHQPRLPAAEQALWQKVQTVVTPAETKPPVVVELAERLGQTREAMTAFLKRCAGRGLLTQVAPNRYYHPSAVAKLARIAEDLASNSEDGTFDAAAYRDLAKVGRNLTIQILEHFDQIKLTRRIGDTRQVVGRAESLFGVANRETEPTST